MTKPLPFSCEVAPIPPRQVNADGSIEFTCQGCGYRVFMSVDDGFDFPACIECRFYGERPFIKREAPPR
jgi:hypothetical protein